MVIYFNEFNKLVVLSVLPSLIKINSLLMHFGFDIEVVRF